MAERSKEKYIEAVGRRKTSVARVRLSAASKNSYTVNGKELHVFFPTQTYRDEAVLPLSVQDSGEHFAIEASVRGGGMHSQATAIAHGIARALLRAKPGTKTVLKKEKMLTRDARAKERRKFGLKKARKAPQWSKR